MKTKIHWCQCGPRHGNFGDKLTPLLFDYFGIPYKWSSAGNADCVGIGSILQSVPEFFTGVIWTSGAICPAQRPSRFSAASVVAVRGKLTLSQIAGQPSDKIVLGDGGLLVSLFRRAATKQFKVGLIPHYAQADDPAVMALAEHPEIRLIDACAPPREVIHHISQCEAILSSSLHGLIVADALEIPNRWVQFPETSSRVIGGDFKFCDYYSVFGIEGLQPTRLSAGESLDTLLPLFEGYSRPGIDSRIDDLLESFGQAFGRRSRPNWQAAAQNIQDRERQALRRLSVSRQQIAGGCLGLSETVTGSGEEELGIPLAEARSQFRDDALKLADLFSGGIDLLRGLRDCGICHGDIREQNLLVRGSSLALINFGWRAISAPAESPAGKPSSGDPAEWTERDTRALGNVLWELSDGDESLRAIAQLMRHQDDAIAIRDFALLQSCVDAITKRLRCSAGLPEAESYASAASPTGPRVDAVDVLLKRIARQEQQIEELKREKELADLQWRSAEYDVIAAELCEHVPPPNRFLIADGEQWRAELQCVGRAIPFLEKDGVYWGMPADDEHAVGELERLRSGEVTYFVLAEPMSWWRDAYPGFFRHLDERFKCCHESSRMSIFCVA